MQTVALLLTATWWKGSGKGTTNRTVSVALARQHSRLLFRGHPTGRVRACSGIANDARVSQTGTTSARFTGARPVTKASITTTESATLFLDKPSIADRSSGKDRMDCMREFRGALDRFSADQARLTEFLEMKRKSARGRICGHSFAQHRLARRTIQWRVWLSEARRTGRGLVVGRPCVGPLKRCECRDYCDHHRNGEKYDGGAVAIPQRQVFSDGLGPEPFSWGSLRWASPEVVRRERDYNDGHDSQYDHLHPEVIRQAT